MDIRLKTDTLTVGDRTYTLRCNFNVLADVQEAFGGDLLAALDDPAVSVRSLLTWLAAMCNDWAEEQGWPERVTPRQLGRLLPLTDRPELQRKVARLLVSAVGRDPEEGGDPNAAATRSSTAASTSRGTSEHG